MSRPSSVPSDNFFLSCYRALTLQRTPIVLRTVMHTLLILGTGLALYAVGMALQFRHAMYEHVDDIGHSLVSQTAFSATGFMAANDNLSLHILLNTLTQNALVAYVGIQGKDGRVIAEAGHRPRQSTTGETPQGQYSSPLTIQNTLAGHLYVALDMRRLQQPLILSQQHMLMFGLGLVFAALLLSIRLGRQVSVPVRQMRQWLEDPTVHPYPTLHEDELGKLLRQLRSRLAPELEQQEFEALNPSSAADDAHHEDLETLEDDAEPSTAGRREPGLTGSKPRATLRSVPTEDEDEDILKAPTTKAPDATHDADENTSNTAKQSRTAILALQFGTPEQLSQIPKVKLQSFQQGVQEHLGQLVKLYRAKQQDLADGSTLLIFQSAPNDQTQSYLSHALCCGELLRAMQHHLQAPLADMGIPISLQLGLGQVKGLSDVSSEDLLLNTSVKAIVSLSRHSQDQLLLDHSVSSEPLIRLRAKVHPIAKPAGACRVEALQDPYPALLERQRLLLTTQTSSNDD